MTSNTNHNQLYMPDSETIVKSLNFARDELLKLIMTHKGDVQSALASKFNKRQYDFRWFPNMRIHIGRSKPDINFCNWYDMLTLLEYAYIDWAASDYSTRRGVELELRDCLFRYLLIRFGKESNFCTSKKILTVVSIELHREFRNQGIGTYILNCLSIVAIQLQTPLMVESANRRLSAYLARVGWIPIQEGANSWIDPRTIQPNTIIVKQ